MKSESRDLSYLPARYAEGWKEPYYELVAPLLRDGVSILDFGGGATPIIPIEMRPAGCRYVGLDISEHELKLAPEGSYDEIVIGLIGEGDLRFEEKFDLILSWQVLEHVRSMGSTLDAIHDSLAVDGIFLAQFAGRNAFFSVLNRLIPDELGKRLMARLISRDPDTVFKAYYDGCTARELEAQAAHWSSFEVIPRYRGGGYLSFAPWLARIYLGYENWTLRTGRKNLATHYILRATK